MQEKGITAYKISKATGISESLFSMWKKKPTSKVSVKNLEAIAEYFEITVDELIGKQHRFTAVDLFTKTAPIAMPYDLPKEPKIPEEWGLGQKTSEEVAEEAELMRLYGKLTAEDKKTVLDLMRRLNNT
jgi:transcriptional regulator with XRE-family HTH domain